MAFPFFPTGALLACAVLVTAFVLFGLALRILDRAWLGLSGSIIPGIVSGMQDWSWRDQPDEPEPPEPPEPPRGSERA